MIYEPIPLKRCYACKTFYPGSREYFSSNKSKKDKLRDECKLCHRKSAKQYKKDHPDKRREADRRYSLRHPENHRARGKRYRLKHPDRYLETKRASYKKRRIQSLEANKKWRKKNPDKVRAIKHRRYAKQISAEGAFTAEDIQRQYKAQKGKCYWCKRKVGRKYHVDHVIPLSRGGSNWPSNIVIACPSCNESKKDKLWGLL